MIYPVSTDGARELGSTIISTIGVLLFWLERKEGIIEGWVGVRGEESTMETGETSDVVGDVARSLCEWRGSAATEVASESVVISEA